MEELWAAGVNFQAYDDETRGKAVRLNSPQNRNFSIVTSVAH